jgi:hypothetical protein
MSEVRTVIRVIPIAIATIIPFERFLRVSGSKVDAPIYKNSPTNIASIMASIFSGITIAVVAKTPATGAKASSIRNDETYKIVLK